MVVGEVANFAAYAYAPAILVTPLGALSILISAVLAHLLLNEKLNVFGIIGCILCVTGSLAIVLHAPEEQPITSVLEIWYQAMQPGNIIAFPNNASFLHLLNQYQTLTDRCLSFS